MSRQFATAVERIKWLRRELYRAESSFRAFEVIQEMRAPNIQGNDHAEANARAMGMYKGFFNISEHALNTEFLVALAKLFDTTSRSGVTSIPKLISYLHSNLPNLTKDDFENYSNRVNREGLELALSDYEGISNAALNELSDLIRGMDGVILKVKALRDKRIAHLETGELTEEQHSAVDVQSTSIAAGVEDLTYAEIAELIKLAVEVLNRISSLLFRDSALYEPLKQQVTDDSEGLISLARDSLSG